MNKLLENIKKNKIKCYFVSPHLDDAALSACGLILDLNKFTDVTVINVFTKAGIPPYTKSAKIYLSLCGHTDAQKLYEERIKEDTEVLSSIGVKIINLNFVDALWRRKKVDNILGRVFKFIPEISFVYPTYKYNIVSGRISRLDKKVEKKIISELSFIDNSSFIFCPVGFGKHVDHIIVRNICSAKFKNLIYWSDFPYSTTDQNNTFLKRKDLGIFTYPVSEERKLKILKGYKTQFSALFPNGSPSLRNEIFYYKK